MTYKKYLSILLVILLILNGPMFVAISEKSENSYQYDFFDMVIVTPEIFIPAVQSLINHKNNHGIQTFLKTTEEIYQQYNGKDEIEQIKYFIKDAVETFNVKYVFLLGDINFVPMRTTAVSWEYYGSEVVSDVITDLYYADIYDENYSFSIWDTNQDGRYSEVRMVMDDEDNYNDTIEIIDEIDGKPDVIVGRIPCSTVREVQNIITKIITYETVTYGNDWFKRLVLLGGDTFPNVGGINEGEVVTDYISSIMPDFTSVKLWTSLNSFNVLNIQKEISKGAGFVSYSGHGLPYGVATSPPDSSNQKSYYTPFIFTLRNNEKYPIMYFDACLTGKLDYAMFNFDIPCFAWSMIKKQNGGAIACIGATRTGFGGFEGDPFMAGASSMHAFFFENYEPGILLGEMFIKTQRAFIENIIEKVIFDPLTIQEFTLLGDPSLKIGGYE